MVTKARIPFREIKAISRKVSPDWRHFAVTVFVCMTGQGDIDNSRERIVSRLVIGRTASEKRRETEGGGGKRSTGRETQGERKEGKFKGKTTIVPRILDRARFAAAPGLEIPPFPRSSAFLFLQPGRTSPRKALENISSYRGIISAVGGINSLKCASRCVSAFPITNLKRRRRRRRRRPQRSRQQHLCTSNVVWETFPFSPRPSSSPPSLSSPSPHVP